ncbi:hypothetical protein EVAR_82455_1 [Eumeta japonica]|uniref:Uncharacterized protein n=1 Tax=Eumeta variegata TaxID=151549 RepID=A0A4C1X423_EUMVA|nr:hypothetical protein EVAR_82455_1 [Eumeta japonica]
MRNELQRSSLQQTRTVTISAAARKWADCISEIPHSHRIRAGISNFRYCISSSKREFRLLTSLRPRAFDLMPFTPGPAHAGGYS